MAPEALVLIDRHVAGRYADATVEALHHAAGHLGVDLAVREIPTAAVERSLLAAPQRGVVVGPGSPYENPEGVLGLIRDARERGVPLVGT
ncbi:MAG TPA: hypothetical protein VFA11_15765 [Acidimicrobiales bacterium]|nr:hypothetical protein [Acidimicrobiales bacterium]